MRTNGVSHPQEHPLRLEDAPVELLEAFLADLAQQNEPLEFADRSSLTAAADVAAARIDSFHRDVAE